MLTQRQRTRRGVWSFGVWRKFQKATGDSWYHPLVINDMLYCLGWLEYDSQCGKWLKGEFIFQIILHCVKIERDYTIDYIVCRTIWHMLCYSFFISCYLFCYIFSGKHCACYLAQHVWQLVTWYYITEKWLSKIIQIYSTVRITPENKQIILQK